MPHLPFGDELAHGSGDILGRHVGLNSVLVVEVYVVGPEPAERVLGRLPDVIGAAVQPLSLSLDQIEAKLRGDHDLVPGLRLHGAQATIMARVESRDHAGMLAVTS